MKNLILIAGMLFSLNAFAQVKSASVYTSVDPKDCTTLESSENDPEPEIDYYVGQCAGKAGYTVQIAGGDLRYSLSLIYKGQEIRFTQIAAFHDVGSKKVEWRGWGGGNGKITKFHSLIYRLSIAELDPATDDLRNRDTLFVVRLNGEKSCLIGAVPQSGTMNEEARAIADDLSKPCLPSEF